MSLVTSLIKRRYFASSSSASILRCVSDLASLDLDLKFKFQKRIALKRRVFNFIRNNRKVVSKGTKTSAVVNTLMHYTHLSTLHLFARTGLQTIFISYWDFYPSFRSISQLHLIQYHKICRQGSGGWQYNLKCGYSVRKKTNEKSFEKVLRKVHRHWLTSVPFKDC